jgi:hypothetical protein
MLDKRGNLLSEEKNDQVDKVEIQIIELIKKNKE